MSFAKTNKISAIESVWSRTSLTLAFLALVLSVTPASAGTEADGLMKAMSDPSNPGYYPQDSQALIQFANGTLTWRKMFADRVIDPASFDKLGPAQSTKNSNGPGGVRTGLDVAGGAWAYAPDFDTNIGFFFNTMAIFGRNRDCLYEKSWTGCLSKMISGSEARIDFYNRCSFDPIKTEARLNFSGGTVLDLQGSRKDFQKAVNKEGQAIGKAEDAVNSKQADAAQKAGKDMEDAMRDQSQAKGIADHLAGERLQRAITIEQKFGDAKHDSDGDICEGVNELGLATLYLDQIKLPEGSYEDKQRLQHQLRIQNRMMGLLYNHGLLMEYTQQLAFRAAAVLLAAKEGGGNPDQELLKDPSIRKYRRGQIELYAQNALLKMKDWDHGNHEAVGLWPQFSLNGKEPGFQTGGKVLFNTLDSELAALVYSYNKDYPGETATFFLGSPYRPSDGENVTIDQLAEKIAKRSWVRQNVDLPQSSGIMSSPDWPCRHKICGKLKTYKERLDCANQHLDGDYNPPPKGKTGWMMNVFGKCEGTSDKYSPMRSLK